MPQMLARCSVVARHSGNAAQILGRIHPTTARIEAHQDRLRVDSPADTVAFRFIRPDGSEVWLEKTSRARFDSTGRPIRLQGLTRDVTRCKQAEKRQELLSDELDHRVKNVLARVAAVVRYTRRRSGNPDEFVRAIEGRIQSIAAAHALLSESRWSGVGLTDLTSSRPTPPMQILRFSGPDVMLLVNDREQASAALAFDMLPLYSTKLRYKSWMIT